MLEASGAVPVVIKRLVFPRNGRGGTRAVGPTLAAEVEAPVKQLPGFYVFGNARAAVLFGDRRQTASLTVNAVLREQGSETAQTLLPVVEGEIGAGYRHPVAWGEIYVRASMVGQAWFNAGNASNTETLATPVATDELTNPNATLGLWGARLASGAKF
jgi:hypothetical protein